MTRNPWPPRRLFGREELRAVEAVFEDSWRRGVDFGFEGPFERAYTKAFCRFQGGGFADAVCSGSAALYVALLALDLPPGAQVVVPPVTDPGGVAPACLLGLKLVVADSGPGGFNVDLGSFERALTPKTRAAIVAHIGGRPADLAAIAALCRRRGIRLVEDCSQAHGASLGGRKVGTFGDIAVFSTMFSKAHATGGTGGLVYTRSRSLYNRVRALADRGKPFDARRFDPKDPRAFRHPALNLNANELGCAIGMATLRKLPATIRRRNAVAAAIDRELARRCSAVRPVPKAKGTCSPFFHTVVVDRARLKVDKPAFARAAAAEGVWLNPHYRYLLEEWPWLKPHLARPADTPNARAFRDSSIQLLFHERFTASDAARIAASFAKVERRLGRS